MSTPSSSWPSEYKQYCTQEAVQARIDDLIELRERVRALEVIATEMRADVKDLVVCIKGGVGGNRSILEGHRSLFGNGQPGIIERLQNRLQRLEVVVILMIGVLLGLGWLSVNSVIAILT